MVGAEAPPAAGRPEPEPTGARVAAAGRGAHAHSSSKNPQPADELAGAGRDIAVGGRAAAPTRGWQRKQLARARRARVQGSSADRTRGRAAGAKPAGAPGHSSLACRRAPRSKNPQSPDELGAAGRDVAVTGKSRGAYPRGAGEATCPKGASARKFR